MQFHLNGFRPSDPDVHDPAAQDQAPPDAGVLAGEVDVLIVGCGPAGLTLAAQLAAFPGIKTQIVDQKPGPLRVGQADGIACRTMEMFQAFGFSERVMREAYWVNETTFWTPDAAQPGHITRSGRVQDTEDGLSEFPHVILNQARVHEFFLDTMRNAAAQLVPCYSRRLVDLQVTPGGDAPSHPVTATFQRTDTAHEGQEETVRARYAIGCDGARSTVRKAIGRSLHGESANHAWGVMDVLAVTDFPDIRLKSLIQSAAEGSIVLIPREGGYLARFYIEMDALRENERVASRTITPEHLIAAANRILHPYSLDVKEIAWWSVYEIGQRLCDKFDDAPDDAADPRGPHVFIAGDSCHTHSPKAGQGMNVSMADSFNLGWKLAAVLQAQATPELLQTYSAERQAVARELIEFDREWAQIISARATPSDTPDAAEPPRFQSYFVQHGRYTAGTAIKYRPSLICGAATHQHLGNGLKIGTRFHSAPVIRLADARPMQLGHTIKADGRWRLFAFAGPGNPADPKSGIRTLCDFLLNAPDSPVLRYTPQTADIDAVIDVRAVFQQGHRTLDIASMPALLLPKKGRYGLCDYEKTFCANPAPGDDIFDLRGLDRAHGCMVIVRPDQYIAHILPLDACADLAAFFAGFMIDRTAGP